LVVYLIRYKFYQAAGPCLPVRQAGLSAGRLFCLVLAATLILSQGGRTALRENSHTAGAAVAGQPCPLEFSKNAARIKPSQPPDTIDKKAYLSF